MSILQPQVLKGFRDFLPDQKKQRDVVLQRVLTVFARHGFVGIETPTIEYESTIMGKYGTEADKLVYAFEDNGGRKVALRYDQTVPTARFIANHSNEIVFPFRRYQAQNVFRADKPQKGRYREFTQCDIDIFGSTDPLADAEILAATYFAYKAIGFETVQLHLNDRTLLFSLLSPYALPETPVTSIIQTIDKLDKLPQEEVIAELIRKGISPLQARQLMEDVQHASIPASLEQIQSLAVALGVDAGALLFAPALARGLDYYTGMIFEVKVPEYASGSLGGGGRYDTLIQDLSGISMSAVGMAIGFDRTLEVAVQLGLVSAPKDEKNILVTVFDQSLYGESAMITNRLRQCGINTTLYPKQDQLSKQLKYASRSGFTHVVLIGPEERDDAVVIVKDLQTRTQIRARVDELFPAR